MENRPEKPGGKTLFKPGESGNPSGKPKGAVNKVTNQMRETFSAIFEDNKEKIQEDLDKVDPKDRLQFWVAMMPYFMPKLTAIRAEHSISGTGHETRTSTELLQLAQFALLHEQQDESEGTEWQEVNDGY